MCRHGIISKVFGKFVLDSKESSRVGNAQDKDMFRHRTAADFLGDEHHQGVLAEGPPNPRIEVMSYTHYKLISSLVLFSLLMFRYRDSTVYSIHLWRCRSHWLTHIQRYCAASGF